MINIHMEAGLHNIILQENINIDCIEWHCYGDHLCTEYHYDGYLNKYSSITYYTAQMLRNARVQVLMCHREVWGEAARRRGGQGEEAGVGVAVGWLVGGELHPRVAGSG